MLTGRKIDDRFLDRWDRDLCSELERSTGRPFALVHDDGPAQGVSRRVWLIDPVLASVCSHAPCACGYIVRYEQDGARMRLWIGVGVTDEPVLGGFLRDSLAMPGFLSSIRALFKRLDAAAFMGQGSWVRSTLTIADGSTVSVTGTLLGEPLQSTVQPLQEADSWSWRFIESMRPPMTWNLILTGSLADSSRILGRSTTASFHE